VLKYTRNLEDDPVVVYTDSYWGSDRIDGRSTSGVLILLYGNPVTWSTEKQINVALSTSEAKYIALTSGFKEAKYFINLMQVEMKIRVTPILLFSVELIIWVLVSWLSNQSPIKGPSTSI
jgi:Flp pilus assembly protein TadG